MATQAQIVANRRNSQKSTGPITPQGKAAISQNALTHGLSAQQTVIRSESQADFDLYRDHILNELAPTSPMESILAERIVNLSWRLKRASSIQNQAIDTLIAQNTSSPLTRLKQSLLPKGPNHPQTDPQKSTPEQALSRSVIKDFSNARVLERLLMYERRIENSLYKTILEIQRLNLVKQLNPKPEITFNKLTP